MIYKIYPTKDATIYESLVNKNTGNDSIVEIQKTLFSTSSNNISLDKPYNSRILMRFNYADLSDISDIGFSTASAGTSKIFLKLYASEEKELPVEYNIDLHIISGSWLMGLGKYDYLPYITDGVTWKYKSGLASNDPWITGSFNAGSTGSWYINPGGGNWFTVQSASQNFIFNQSDDVEMDITTLLYATHFTSASTYPNSGFLLKRPDLEEHSIADEVNLQYFSSDTNTIYLPHLLIKHDDWAYSTGSLSTISDLNENVVYFKNLHETYTTNDRVKFRLSGREKYPVKTFTTGSAYATEYILPASSSYSIEDLHTKEIVIAHDNIYTRISCDASGSYFNFRMNALQPERWYKFTIKSTFNASDVRIFDSNFIFKVERTV